MFLGQPGLSIYKQTLAEKHLQGSAAILSAAIKETLIGLFVRQLNLFWLRVAV